MADTRHATASGAGQVDFSKALNDVWVEKRFVEMLTVNLVAAALGKESTLVENSGKKCRWNYLTAPAADTTALTTEGGDPVNDNQQLTLNTAEATLVEYGHDLDYSKFLKLTGVNGTIDEIIEAMAYQAALSIDTLVLTELANATTTLDSGTAFRADILRQAASSLGDSKARRHPMSPGGKFFVAIVSNEAGYDMIGEGAPTWVQARSQDFQAALTSTYDNTRITDAVYDVIVKISENVQGDGSTPVNDLNYVCGKDFFGTLSLRMPGDFRPRAIVHPPEGRTDVVLENRGTVAWWALFAAKIIDDNRGLEILSDRS